MTRASATLIRRISTERLHLSNLERDLMKVGDKELAAAVKRARRELDHGSVTGIENSAPMRSKGA